MSNLHKHVVIHQHRHGESVYTVDSNVILNEFKEDHLNTLIEKLEIDFEPDIDEYITIHLVDKTDATIMLGDK